MELIKFFKDKKYADKFIKGSFIMGDLVHYKYIEDDRVDITELSLNYKNGNHDLKKVLAYTQNELPQKFIS